MRLNCMQFCLKTSNDPGTPSPSSSPFVAMMKQVTSASHTYVWPEDYPTGANQSTRDVLNSLLGNLRMDPAAYGGFQTIASAAHADNRFFWRLAVITEALAPHAKAMSDRSAAIPKVFMEASGKQCVCSGHEHVKTCIKFKSNGRLTQEMCSKCVDQLNSILGKPDVFVKRFRFSFHIQELRDSIATYKKYLQKKASDVGTAQHNTERQNRIRGAYVVPPQGKAFSDLSNGDQLAVSRITARLELEDDFVFVRVDSLLFTDDEDSHNQTLANPWRAKERRLKHLFDEDGGPFSFRGYPFRYEAGASVGGFWNYLMKLPPRHHNDASNTNNAETVRVLAAMNTLKDKHILPSALPRAILRAFKDRYKTKIAGLKDPGVLDELVAHVLGNTAAGSHAAKDVDVRRRVELFMDTDEGDAEDMVIDLRRHNGRKEVSPCCPILS